MIATQVPSMKTGAFKILIFQQNGYNKKAVSSLTSKVVDFMFYHYRLIPVQRLSGCFGS